MKPLLRSGNRTPSQTLRLFAQQTLTGRRTAAWNEPRTPAYAFESDPKIVHLSVFCPEWHWPHCVPKICPEFKGHLVSIFFWVSFGSSPRRAVFVQKLQMFGQCTKLFRQTPSDLVRKGGSTEKSRGAPFSATLSTSQPVQASCLSHFSEHGNRSLEDQKTVLFFHLRLERHNILW